MPFLGVEGVTKKARYSAVTYKGEAEVVCRFKRVLAKKRGGVFEGGLILQCSLCRHVSMVDMSQSGRLVTLYVFLTV